MAFFPRLIANDLAPVFRLVDDYASLFATRGSNGFSHVISKNVRTFQPRFDVTESREAYELHGELPGIQQKDINIEFTDATTLSIKGRTESVREEGARPSAIEETPWAPVEATQPAAVETQQAEQASVAESETTSGYHKATVEDDNAQVVSSSTESVATPAETPAETITQSTQEVSKPQSKVDSSRHWVSERSVGHFARSFRFPSRVDHENVKASLKNGILSVVIPKAAAPVSRRVYIE